MAFEDNSVIVGSDAKEESSIKPETTVLLAKSYMGKKVSMLDYNGEPKMPEEISSYILKKLTRDASEQLGVEVKDVVITCPAYFGTAERTATKNAGKIAGLNVLEIISEPTAAAIYYGCTRKLIVNIAIYENDSMEEYFELEENLKLGDVNLELPKGFPKKSPIEITLKLTKEGILEVKGLDKTSNKKVKVEMNTKGIMLNEELEKIKCKVQGITLI